MGGGRLMIRLEEFFKMSEGDMRDFLVCKKVYNQDKILEELDILGYIAPWKSVLFKKAHCHGYRAHDPDGSIRGITIYSNYRPDKAAVRVVIIFNVYYAPNRTAGPELTVATVYKAWV